MPITSRKDRAQVSLVTVILHLPSRKLENDTFPSNIYLSNNFPAISCHVWIQWQRSTRASQKINCFQIDPVLWSRFLNPHELPCYSPALQFCYYGFYLFRRSYPRYCVPIVSCSCYRRNTLFCIWHQEFLFLFFQAFMPRICHFPWASFPHIFIFLSLSLVLLPFFFFISSFLFFHLFSLLIPSLFHTLSHLIFLFFLHLPLFPLLL